MKAMSQLSLLLLLLFSTGSTHARSIYLVEAVSDLWLDISLGPPLVDWFNEVARPGDIARVENINQIDLLDQVTAGRTLVVFKSIGDAEQLMPSLAGKVDIIGYNLELGPQNLADEQADPIGSAMRMRELADQYGLQLAFGPDRSFALSSGVEIAPFVDIFVLQIQRVQTEPGTVDRFITPLIPRLRQANPDLQISVQIRTEGDVVMLGDLVETHKRVLDGVSVLTSPETVDVAMALVEELQMRDSTAVAEQETLRDERAGGAIVEDALSTGEDNRKAGQTPISTRSLLPFIVAAFSAGVVVGIIVHWYLGRRRLL